MARSAPFSGWRMVGVAFLVDFIAVGFFFYSFGVYYRAIDADFAGGTVWVAAGISISNLVGGFFAPFVGQALDRFSIKRVMLLGACIVSAGFAALSLTATLWQYYLVLGSFFALGLGMMGGMASSKLVANWFIAKRGQAFGIATMGVSLSGIVMPTVATWLVAELGWRGGFQVYAAGILVIVLPVVALLIVTTPEEVGQRPDGGAPEDPEPPAAAADVVWSTGQVLRSGNFWAITLPFGLSFSALSAVLIHLVPYAEDLGFDGYLPARVLSASAAAGMLGKPFFGRLVDRVDPRVAVWTSFGIQLVGLGLLMNVTSYATLLGGAVVFGFGMGGVVPLQGAVSGQAFGRLSFGRVMGLMQPVRVPLNMIGVPLAAWIRDATGSFDLAFWIFAAVYVLSAAIIVRLRVPSDE